MFRTLALLVVLMLGYTSLSNASINNLTEQQKISYLLNTIETSKVIFVRNGIEYSGAEAREHLQIKLEAAGNSIQTVDDFIAYIASHSSLTGEPYYIKFPDGTMIEAEIWLHNKLLD